MQTIQPIPAFADNYIWIITEAGSNKACVVDPGDATPVIEYLEAQQLELSDILITHHHADHTGGVQELKDKYSPRVIGPTTSNIQGITQAVSQGSQVELFEQNFEVIEVPGHTLDHIAFFCSETENSLPVLFCGDTLFAAGCGRLFEGSPAMMHESLAKLTSLAHNTRVFCTHEYTMANLNFAIAVDSDNELLKKRIIEEQAKRDRNQPTLPSSIELELATNPFLRCTDSKLISSAHDQLGRNPENEVEVFSALRSHKDNF
ncbi:MAG: hydroxyacylglutathione hydrolase [SAR86 cluster bacterium]|uniref:Hydroxyacylglutathione hydrolase n=1 Tax=SAR86 cluster bacterium TaxID=2030880 RepID=A0A2A5BAY8_9GAMM|nr:MAG: hydroxyacylglutathione hydrolase [SAR86 cluster bacterium]